MRCGRPQGEVEQSLSTQTGYPARAIASREAVIARNSRGPAPAPPAARGSARRRPDDVMSAQPKNALPVPVVTITLTAASPWACCAPSAMPPAHGQAEAAGRRIAEDDDGHRAAYRLAGAHGGIDLPGRTRGRIWASVHSGRRGYSPGLELPQHRSTRRPHHMLFVTKVLLIVGVCVVAVACGGSSDDMADPTGPVQWSETVTVGEGSGISGPPLATFSLDGTATLLWNRYTGRGGVYAPVAARSQGMAAWSVPLELETVPATLQSFVLALTQAAGQPVAVWVKQDVQAPGVIRAARFGTVWGAPQSLSANSLGGPGDFASSANGEAFGVWTEYDGARYALVSAKCDSTGTWTRAPDVATTNATIDPEPVIATDAAGNAVALWVEGTPGRIHAARLATGQTAWSPPVMIDSGDAASSRPRIVSIGSVAFAAAWDQTLNQQLSVHATHFDGLSWFPPVPLDIRNGNGAGGARLASNGQGRAIAVWVRIEGSLESFWSAAFDGSGWRAPLQVIGPTNLGIRVGPALAIDASGRPLVAWTLTGGANQAVEYSALDDRSSRWTQPVRLSTGDVEPTSPALAVNRDGQAVIAWVGIDGAVRSVRARIGRRP